MVDLPVRQLVRPQQPVERGTPFARELDMRPVVAGLAANLAAGLPGHRSLNAYVLFEVPAAGGVPDLIRVAFDPAVVRRRAQLGLVPVVDQTAMRVLTAVSSGPRPLAVVAMQAAISTAHLRRTVVPALVEAGWLAPLKARGDQADVCPTLRHRSLVRSVVTVEVKRRDWRGAIRQARRHTSCADRAYIAIDAATSGQLLRVAAPLSQAGIGVITVDSDSSTAFVVTRPAAGFPRPDEHRLIGERAWSLVLAGTDTWATFDVFGRDLTAR
jgi:hypothetical protein